MTCMLETGIFNLTKCHCDIFECSSVSDRSDTAATCAVEHNAFNTTNNSDVLWDSRNFVRIGLYNGNFITSLCCSNSRVESLILHRTDFCDGLDLANPVNICFAFYLVACIS